MPLNTLKRYRLPEKIETLPVFKRSIMAFANMMLTAFVDNNTLAINYVREQQKSIIRESIRYIGNQIGETKPELQDVSDREILTCVLNGLENNNIDY